MPGRKDLKDKFGLKPGMALRDELYLPLSTKRSELLYTKAIDWLKRWLAYHDFPKGWIPFAPEAIADLAGQEGMGAISTTSPPESWQIIGAQAKRVFGCLWITDLRDLWTQNLAEQKYSCLPLRIRLEKKTLTVSDAVVTVSAPWADRLSQRYPARPIHTATNTFHPDDSPRRPQELTRTFSLTYAGQIGERKGLLFLHP